MSVKKNGNGMVHNETIKPKLIFVPTGQKQPQFYVKFNLTVNIRFPKKKNHCTWTRRNNKPDTRNKLLPEEVTVTRLLSPDVPRISWNPETNLAPKRLPVGSHEKDKSSLRLHLPTLRPLRSNLVLAFIHAYAFQTVNCSRVTSSKYYVPPVFSFFFILSF
jgi:hypothetical protein